MYVLENTGMCKLVILAFSIQIKRNKLTFIYMIKLLQVSYGNIDSCMIYENCISIFAAALINLAGEFIKYHSLEEDDMFCLYEDGCKKLVSFWMILKQLIKLVAISSASKLKDRSK